MTLSNTARRNAAYYRISEDEIAAVLAQPDRRQRGRAKHGRGAVVMSRLVDGRTIVVVADHACEIVITAYVPDDEWSELAAPARRLTMHARERMEALGLTPADVDYVIENASKRDSDGKGNLRSHLIHEGRYLVVVTDALKTEVITVICRDSLWSGVSVEEAAACARTAPECSYEEIIANLREQCHNEVAEARQERDAWRLRAEEAEQRIAAVSAILGDGPVAA